MKAILTSCRRLIARAWPFVAAAMILTPVFLACGCKSGTGTIARAASNTDVLASRISDHSRALEPMVAGIPEAKPHIDGINQAAADIKIEARKVHEALPSVKDVTPWWASLLGNGFVLLIIASAVGVTIWFMYALGFGAPVTAFCQLLNSWIARLIPSPLKKKVAAFKAKRENK